MSTVEFSIQTTAAAATTSTAITTATPSPPTAVNTNQNQGVEQINILIDSPAESSAFSVLYRLYGKIAPTFFRAYARTLEIASKLSANSSGRTARLKRLDTTQSFSMTGGAFKGITPSLENPFHIPTNPAPALTSESYAARAVEYRPEHGVLTTTAAATAAVTTTTTRPTLFGTSTEEERELGSNEVNWHMLFRYEIDPIAIYRLQYDAQHVASCGQQGIDWKKMEEEFCALPEDRHTPGVVSIMLYTALPDQQKKQEWRLAEACQRRFDINTTSTSLTDVTNNILTVARKVGRPAKRAPTATTGSDGVGTVSAVQTAVSETRYYEDEHLLRQHLQNAQKLYTGLFGISAQKNDRMCIICKHEIQAQDIIVGDVRNCSYCGKNNNVYHRSCLDQLDEVHHIMMDTARRRGHICRKHSCCRPLTVMTRAFATKMYRRNAGELDKMRKNGSLLEERSREPAPEGISQSDWVNMHRLASGNVQFISRNGQVISISECLTGTVVRAPKEGVRKRKHDGGGGGGGDEMTTCNSDDDDDDGDGDNGTGTGGQDASSPSKRVAMSGVLGRPAIAPPSARARAQTQQRNPGSINACSRCNAGYHEVCADMHQRACAPPKITGRLPFNTKSPATTTTSASAAAAPATPGRKTRRKNEMDEDHKLRLQLAYHAMYNYDPNKWICPECDSYYDQCFCSVENSTFLDITSRMPSRHPVTPFLHIWEDTLPRSDDVPTPYERVNTEREFGSRSKARKNRNLQILEFFANKVNDAPANGGLPSMLRRRCTASVPYEAIWMQDRCGMFEPCAANRTNSGNGDVGLGCRGRRHRLCRSPFCINPDDSVTMCMCLFCSYCLDCVLMITDQAVCVPKDSIEPASCVLNNTIYAEFTAENISFSTLVAMIQQTLRRDDVRQTPGNFNVYRTSVYALTFGYVCDASGLLNPQAELVHGRTLSACYLWSFHRTMQEFWQRKQQALHSGQPQHVAYFTDDVMADEADQVARACAYVVRLLHGFDADRQPLITSAELEDAVKSSNLYEVIWSHVLANVASDSSIAPFRVHTPASAESESQTRDNMMWSRSDDAYSCARHLYEQRFTMRPESTTVQITHESIDAETMALLLRDDIMEVGEAEAEAAAATGAATQESSQPPPPPPPVSLQRTTSHGYHVMEVDDMQQSKTMSTSHSQWWSTEGADGEDWRDNCSILTAQTYHSGHTGFVENSDGAGADGGGSGSTMEQCGVEVDNDIISEETL